MLLLSILMCLLCCRACDAITEGKSGEEVNRKHQVFKIIFIICSFITSKEFQARISNREFHSKNFIHTGTT